MFGPVGGPQDVPPRRVQQLEEVPRQELSSMGLDTGRGLGESRGPREGRPGWQTGGGSSVTG